MMNIFAEFNLKYYQNDLQCQKFGCQNRKGCQNSNFSRFFRPFSPNICLLLFLAYVPFFNPKFYQRKTWLPFFNRKDCHFSKRHN